MAELVIDEWLWADLAGDNSMKAQGEAFAFLEAVFNRCDRIVTVRGSQFEQKAFALWTHHDITRRRIARYYRAHFWYNANKTTLLEESDLQPIPEQIANSIESKDHYLIQAYLTVHAKVIVTTDNPLKDAARRNNINCQPRDQFIQAYVEQNRTK